MSGGSMDYVYLRVRDCIGTIMHPWTPETGMISGVAAATMLDKRKTPPVDTAKKS